MVRSKPSAMEMTTQLKLELDLIMKIEFSLTISKLNPSIAGDSAVLRTT